MKRDPLMRAITEAGGIVERRRSNHYKITLPDGAVYFTGGTPSDHRARKNMVADLRKLGLDVRGVA